MRARSRFGIAIAAMIKMIATTMSNSINEKPELARACALEPFVPTLERNQTASMLNREETSLDRSRLSRLFHQSPYCAATMVTIAVCLPDTCAIFRNLHELGLS